MVSLPHTLSGTHGPEVQNPRPLAWLLCCSFPHEPRRLSPRFQGLRPYGVPSVRLGSTYTSASWLLPIRPEIVLRKTVSFPYNMRVLNPVSAPPRCCLCTLEVMVSGQSMFGFFTVYAARRGVDSQMHAVRLSPLMQPGFTHRFWQLSHTSNKRL